MRRRKYSKSRRPEHRQSNPGGTTRKRMLDRGRMSRFVFDLANLLKKIPNEQDRQPIFASIYSKATNLGIEEAEEFINEKVKAGILEKELASEILSLLDMHSRFR